jgi:hypothetical protein
LIIDIFIFDLPQIADYFSRHAITYAITPAISPLRRH